MSNEEYLGYMRKRISDMVKPVTTGLQRTLDGAARRGEIEYMMYVCSCSTLHSSIFLCS